MIYLFFFNPAYLAPTHKYSCCFVIELESWPLTFDLQLCIILKSLHKVFFF